VTVVECFKLLMVGFLVNIGFLPNLVLVPLFFVKNCYALVYVFDLRSLSALRSFRRWDWYFYRLPKNLVHFVVGIGIFTKESFSKFLLGWFFFFTKKWSKSTTKWSK